MNVTAIRGCYSHSPNAFVTDVMMAAAFSFTWTLFCFFMGSKKQL